MQAPIPMRFRLVRLGAVLGQSVDVLIANRARSALTILGLVWGVASLVILVTLSRGVQQGITQAVRVMGNELIFISPGQTSVASSGGEKAGRAIQFDMTHVESLRTGSSLIRRATPEISLAAQYEHLGETTRAPLIAVAPEYESMRQIPVAEGRFISPTDEVSLRRAIVIGSEIRRRLFGARPALGRDLRLNGRRFTIVGIIQQRAQGAGEDIDRRAYLPFTTARILTDTRHLNRILIAPTSLGEHAAAAAKAREILARRCRFQLGDPRALGIWDSIDTVATFERMADALKLVIGAIGLITLAIGGVGLMNIMLVSVTERTREIGTRRALGARRRDVLLQIVVETMVIDLAGGFAGVLLAALLCRTFPPLELPGGGVAAFRLSPAALIVAIGALALVGLSAAVWPARKACLLQPAQAVRYE